MSAPPIGVQPVSSRGVLAAAGGLVLILSAVRAVFAAALDLRFDEAYHWTWSKESVLSFLDHPPMVAWFIRFGTALFGDTPFGVRFGGLLAMFGMQVFLADIVRRKTSGVWPVVFVLLAPEAALYYGQMIVWATPDAPHVLYLSGLLWALVRLDESRDPRWWLLAGVFGGLMLVTKYTSVFVVPAILAFVLWPPRNRGWLLTVWPWAASAIAIGLFSPVLVWNARYDWASFKFQLLRATADQSYWLHTLGDFVGAQLALVGPVLYPVLVVGTAAALVRGYRQRNATLILLTTAVAVPFLYFLWRSIALRVNTTWLVFLWPSAMAAAAINIDFLLASPRAGAKSAVRLAFAGVAIGLVLVPFDSIFYVVGNRPLFDRHDPIGKAAGFGELANQAAAVAEKTGAIWMATTEYQTYAMLRWELRDHIPVVQINERCRYLGLRPPDLARIEGHRGLWVAARSMRSAGIWAHTSAVLAPVGTADRLWRGQVYETYDFETVSNWTPELSPPPGSALFECTPV